MVQNEGNHAVFRDNIFETSPEKIDVEQIFKLMTQNTHMRVIRWTIKTHFYVKISTFGLFWMKKEKWYFSIINIVSILTNQPTSRNACTYWAVLEKRLIEESFELLTNCKQLKMTAADEKKHIKYLFERLTKGFYEGFAELNLRTMQQIYILPIRHAVRAELSWSNYWLLIHVEKENHRNFYKDALDLLDPLLSIGQTFSTFFVKNEKFSEFAATALKQQSTTAKFNLNCWHYISKILM
jgi:hypothetical protein